MTGHRRLRVVHIITALGTGGAERQVELLAAYSRHDAQVIGLYASGVVGDAIQARGIAVSVLGMAGWQKITAIPRLARRLRRLHPDVVHVHLLSGQLWGILAARVARVPVVVSTEHSIMAGSIEGRPDTRALRWTYRLLERLATHTIAVSAATARRLTVWGVGPGPRLSVINPPIDFDALARECAERDEVRAELDLPQDAFVVAAIGRLEPVKRLDRLVRALVGQLRNGTHLMLIGDGALRDDLSRLTTELGVERAVHLLGSRGDLARLLDAADVVVSPSRDETFGMAVVEALGAGLPVVYAECPALDDIAMTADRVVRVDRCAEPDRELDELAAGVDALARAGRRAVDGELVDRYGAAATAGRVDDLYDRLDRRRGGQLDARR